ncbi:Nitrate transporter, periplasmic nitrate binding protein [Magnetospirillum gryphiswaldense MSR-1 v2]|uniref:Nitrate transporter, periplasmic nitrate binding protein n=1 Tax=Magnetospirillum gryphiswaldense (strain DSM 6361 / JCM 21280 / NBRC 15271 / MSR-1) TaxID=431944 RepID=V6EVV5_MAGGM|nr:CmpA/NrtA family ABC transporter substrate-binding protein [Magnetospirillum gryphiswaldense]CDK97400.1 Nitrate transporter, periplasmic nitrate binding protein [Magnetospirillum gryphiswaldense MSR-1 v2]
MTDTLTRRSLLKVSGTAAVLAAARTALPGGAWAATGDAPEVKGATFGFIALTDSSPLIIAKEKGFFAKYGLPDVQVVKQASWGTTRDNLELGSAGGGIDGAHILTPMPYLMASGRVTKNSTKVPMNILARLNTNGQSISVSNTYKTLHVGTAAKALGEAFAKARATGKEVKVAMTFPGGTHDLWLRYWLAANGVDPDKDVSTIVVPPPQMVANMKVDTMEAFCVGEPWNAQLINQGIGYTALTTGELWKDHPEKSLAMRGDWVEKNPKAAKAVTMAVLEAQAWCEANIEEMCKIVSGREWFKVPYEDIVARSKGRYDYGTGKVVENSPYVMKFWKDFASYPFQSHDLWFLTENIRWGYQPADVDTKALIKAVNREDIWRDAAKALGVAAADIPATTSRGIETFFDGKTFDPANPQAYLKSLTIKRV